MFSPGILLTGIQPKAFSRALPSSLQAAQNGCLAHCDALAAACLTLLVVDCFRASGLPLPNPTDDTTTLAAATEE
ncbi:hypothetical protein [Mesorhizobium comanense]|uniref:hypothetical protein n=1 Tax=Mesorhizobium comanense TaxID=2502215 RepID=UPI0014857327|nr:hypothetical protein [Mesorhizobium comanense]